MIYLDIAKACSNKGIDDPKRWLVKNGFSHVAAGRLMQHSAERLNYDTLEKLCSLLYCTPNEILSWQPKESVLLSPEHPLHKIKKLNSGASINAKLKTLSPEKIEEVQKFLDGLKEG